MSEAALDAYDTLIGLIALTADGKASTARIAELQKLERQIAKAQAKLDADRETHAATAAALEAREVAVTERERVVREWEAEAYARGEREKYPFDPNGGRFSRSHTGLVRA